MNWRAAATATAAVLCLAYAAAIWVALCIHFGPAFFIGSGIALLVGVLWWAMYMAFGK